MPFGKVPASRAGFALGALLLASAVASGCTTESPAPTASEDLGSARQALNANEQTAYDFFVAKGLKNFQAAGIVGNLIQESNVDPTIAQFGGGPGRGIAQWSVGGRWDTDFHDNAVWYAGTKGQSVWSLNLQLEFIWYELQTFSGYGLSQLQASTDVTGATIAFEVHFEGCGQCNESGRIADAQQVLNAWGATPPPPPPPPPPNVDGYIDSAGDVVKGWAADPNAGTTALKVDLAFDGAAGMGYGITVTASDPRPDVAAALHIGPDHGFAVPTPRYYCDGKSHAVHAYGHDVMNAAVELKQSPMNFTCAPTPVGPGLLRHVASPPVLAAWSFDVRKLESWMTTADRAAHTVGADWPATKTLGRTADGAVWVVDGNDRRHVVDPASFAAWGFNTADLKAWTAADAAKYAQGLDLPAKPVLVQTIGDPAVYVLDTEPAAPPPSATTSTGTGSGAGGAGSGAGGSGSSGTSGDVHPLSKSTCSFAPQGSAPSGAGWALGAAFALGMLGARRRRSGGAR